VGRTQGKALAAHPDVGGLLFTGSAQTGIAINRQSMPTQPSARFWRSKWAAIIRIVVWDTPEIPCCCRAGGASRPFMSAGQRCTAASRLIVRDETA
jgi:succinylglutamic semialdehyde dehydrogenase